ncbi:MAG: heparan-alpha-glucosaminide N-acetyltransferase domain-containing protein [Actinomycetes bacterium]
MATLGGSSRNVGVDLARAVALLGIMAVHIFPAVQQDGDAHPAFLIDSGRTPALFPLLAGVGLALAHGGRRPPLPPAIWRDREGIVARAALLIALGLMLGMVDSPPLVILVDFGFMFLGATFFLRLGARSLWWLAVSWAVVVPTLSFVVRTGPAGTAGSPQLPGPFGVAQPLVDIGLTSSYPVLVWLAYVLLGLAIGRTGLGPPGAALHLVLVGAVVAITAKLVSWASLSLVGGPERLADDTEGLSVVAPDMATQLQVGLAGTTPTTDWAWLLVTAPHSSTTLDLFHTGGAAAAILGGCLVVADRVPRRRLTALVAFGSMTLTLYCLHVLALARSGPFLHPNPLVLYAAQVAVGVGAATMWRTYVGRGPLEALAALLDRSSRSVVRNRTRARVRAG